MTPLVSIIIPTYNRAHLIGETLDSILAQTYTHWECIVVDDGSTDNTDEVLAAYCKKDSRFQYHHRPKDRLKGGNAARNYGFELSKGKYIQWFDSDDLMDDNKITVQIKLFKNADIKASVCNSAFFYFYPRDMDSLVLWSNSEGTNKLVSNVLNQKYRIPTSSILWGRNTVENFIWDGNIVRGQEWLFHMKVLLGLNNKDLTFTPEILAWVRKTKESKTISDTVLVRYEEYLNARISFLRYLKTMNRKTYCQYFFIMYKNSLKYVRVLIKNNKFRILYNFSKLVLYYKMKSFLFFLIGIFGFKLFKNNYFLINAI